MILSISSTGGYYSDIAAFVSDSCKRCPIGTFVHKNKAPGKSSLSCSTCPEGQILEYRFNKTKSCNLSKVNKVNNAQPKTF